MNHHHYVCTGGCQGVSETLGVCQAKDCPNFGKPLTECDCADGQHGTAPLTEEGPREAQ